MKTNIINFPSAAAGLTAAIGTAVAKQEVIDAMSDKDWRRIVQWESRYARIAGQEGSVCGK